MKAILTHLKKVRTILFLLGTVVLILIVGSEVVRANLGGSNVTFASDSDGAPCYIPNRTAQTLCFEATSISSDGEDVDTSFWQFPADWTVYTPSIQTDSASCESGTFSGGHLWTAVGVAGQYSLSHTRQHDAGGTCSAIYCFDVNTGATESDPVPVSWIWYGEETDKNPPHQPCSSDGYYGPLSACDYSVDPPAMVPICEHVTLNILPETLPAGEVGVWYSQQLSVENETGPFSWSSSGLPVPMGIVGTSGELQGTPSTTGTIEFTAYVKGTGWSDGARNYSLVIHPALTFSPSILSIARLNTAYSQEVSVSGRTDETPVLTLDSGALPDGITFSGSAFTGTPTETGTFENIVVKASYTDGLVKFNTYTLKVLPEHLFTWEPALPDEKMAVTFTPFAGYSNYYWRFAYNPGEDCSEFGDYVNPAIHTFWQSGEYQVCLQFWAGTQWVTDNQGVTVSNLAPVIESLEVYSSPSFPGMAVSGYVDYDLGPTPFTCQVDWGDGTGLQSFSCGNGYAELPEHTYSGVGTFTVEVSVTDGEGLTGTESVVHEVVYLLAFPPDTYLASNSVATTVELMGVAALGHTPLSFNIDANSTLGTLGIPSLEACELYDEGVMQCRATVQYSPPPDTGTGFYTGSDSFDFYVDDDLGNDSNSVSVPLWVDENAAPTAVAGSKTVSALEPTMVMLRATDPDFHNWIHDRITFIIDAGPSHGSLTEIEGVNCDVEWDESGEFISCSSIYEYSPDPGNTFTEDSFTFHVNDSHFDSDIAIFELTLHTPATLIVNAIDDEVDENGCDMTHCSLREAVEAGEVGDIITFDLEERSNTIILAGEAIKIDQNLVINGPGADKLAISADEKSRVFSIGAEGEVAANVIISGLQIRDGRENEGGGIMVNDGNTLTMEDCVIGPNNIVDYAGGGIFNERGFLTLTRCTVTENEGTGSLGGAGITTVGRAITTLINSTVSGNVTNNFGGGIYVAYDGLVSLIHTTVSGNISNANYLEEGEERGGGAGIFIDVEGQVELINSIVAGNTDMSDPLTASHDPWPDVYGEVTSLGGNLIGEGTGSSGWVVGDQVGTMAEPIDPLLDDLALNPPGSTKTFALLESSTAIDAVECPDGVDEDQRGIDRPQGSACDIGAYELEQAPATGSLKISKVFNSQTSGFMATFAIEYDCDDGTVHDGTVNLAAGESTTITGIPTGTHCTVTETTLPEAPAGWSFGIPTFSPTNGTVTIGETTADVMVTNSIAPNTPTKRFAFLPLIIFGSTGK